MIIFFLVSVLEANQSAKSDVNDLQWNGETDDEAWRTGRRGSMTGVRQVKNSRDPGQPTESERREHMNTNQPHTSWSSSA